jgi:tRNA/tmRNA/rRNA uracil-C5-methylase (TrmA/RlmC/RlmD family)
MLYGEPVEERLDGTVLACSPLSFLQANLPVTEDVLRHIRGVIGDQPDPVLLDAYAGIGALSLPLASRFPEVLAVERVAESCALARLNAGANGADNYHVHHGDAGALLGTLLSRLGDRARGAPRTPATHRAVAVPACLIVDPPRGGLSARVRAAIASAPPRLLLYLSCHPHTQARDLVELTRGAGYIVEQIIPFDMFPQTYHVECLAVLRQRERT